jgi:hypothetical protein
MWQVEYMPFGTKGSFTPVLMGHGFLLRIGINSVSHMLFIPLVLAKFRYWQEFYPSEFE